MGTDFDNDELKQTINDITAFAHLGHYYSEKIRGATELTFYIMTSDVQRKKNAISHLEKALGHWKNYAAVMSSQYLPRALARTQRIDWNALTKDVERDIERAGTAEKYQLDISFGDMKDGDEFPRGTDLTVTVSVKSTFDVAVVTIKVNGEDLIDDSVAPYQWDGESTPLLKNIAPGIYEFVAVATDNMGHKAEKTIKIMVKQ